MSKLLFIAMFWLGCGAAVARGQADSQESTSGEGTLLAVPADELPPYICNNPVPIGFTQGPPAPALPDSQALVRLGRQLFFDPKLSADESLACATCHRPEHGFAAPQRVAVGIGQRVGRRNAPSLLNRAFGQTHFWDGRAASLEEQALEPIGNPDELGSSVAAVVERLGNDPDYSAQFAAAFAGADETVAPDRKLTEGDSAEGDSARPTAVTAARLARALAAFQRTLLAGNSAADQFRHGAYSALSDSQRHGMWLFESRGRCWMCHSGDHLSDELFHNTGVGFGNPDRDAGRMAVTRRDDDRFRFKTPGLRGVALTPPYFHDGSAATLEQVVQFYNRGGAPDDPNLDPQLQPLNLSDDDVRALADFLRALTPEPENPR